MGDPLRTALCTRLGIRLPIIQAPMAGGWTTPELAAAVSNAGGLGMLAGARVSIEQLDAQIRRALTLTHAPIGVNFLIADTEPATPADPALIAVLDEARAALGPASGSASSAAAAPEGPPPPRGPLPPQPSIDEMVDLALSHKVPVISFALGDPARYVERVHRAGALVAASVTTVEEAVRVASAGVDIVVAQGAEAGGHRSSFDLGPDDEPPLIGTLALVPQVVDAVRCPTVASGGIMDARGVLAVLVLGAAGAQLGTRFLLAAEANVYPGYRDRLLSAVETDTVITRAFSGRPARSMRNRFIDEMARRGARPLPWPHQSAAARDIYQRAQAAGDPEWGPIFAGQGLRLARDVEPAGQIVARIEREARALLERFG